LAESLPFPLLAAGGRRLVVVLGAGVVVVVAQAEFEVSLVMLQERPDEVLASRVHRFNLGLCHGHGHKAAQGCQANRRRFEAVLDRCRHEPVSHVALLILGWTLHLPKPSMLPRAATQNHFIEIIRLVTALYTHHFKGSVFYGRLWPPKDTQHHTWRLCTCFIQVTSSTYTVVCRQ